MQEPVKSQFTLVTPTKSDWQKFKTLRLESLQTDPQAFGGTFESNYAKEDSEWIEQISNPQNVYVCAEIGGEYIGVMGAFTKDENKTWRLMAVFVKPKYRGQSISSSLLKYIIDGVKKRGANSIELLVNIKQSAAVALYKQHNFEVVETVTGQKMGDGSIVDEFKMELVL